MDFWTWAVTSSFFGGGNDRIRIVPLAQLKGHEMPDEGRVGELEEDMRRRGKLLKPIVADRESKVILDGHCRCGALRRLGCSKVAVRFVDYSSGVIRVEGWDGGKVTKSEVVEAGLRGNLMMPKSSRHTVVRNGRKLHISEVCSNVCIRLSELV